MKLSGTLFSALVSLASLGPVLACTTTPPPAPPRDDTAVPPLVPVPAPPVATASAPDAAAAAAAAPGDGGADGGPVGTAATKSSACTTDADCRTFASYCSESPCSCRVLTKSDPDPTCVGAGAKVQCFVSPCMKKVAHCESNVCVLVTQTAGAAPKATK
ncbi:MAG: hypothetical protein JWP97_525 [Labilithrix sp.]|nr:hypothetical protein [Labilithrix sp.]